MQRESVCAIGFYVNCDLPGRIYFFGNFVLKYTL